jgi:hypothetical protein
MTTTPFTFADNVLSGRTDIFDESTADQYVPFIINRHLSYFVDTVHYANDMNMYSDLPKYAQYRYYLNTIPKRKRFSKWEKKSSDQVIEAISKRFQCNQQRAEEYASLLPDDVKQQIVNEMGSSDGKRSTKSGRGRAKASR